MLDVGRLRLLKELRARGTVTAVADTLSYSPSAVSQQLAALQVEAGVPLVERVGRRLRLTDAGRLLADHAEVVLGLLDAAETDMSRAAASVVGRLRVASFQTAAHALVAPVIGALHRRHPELTIELDQADAGKALEALRLGDFDLVIGEEYDHAPRPRDSMVDRLEVFIDPLLVALPVAHPLSGEHEVALADLAGEAWAAGERGTLYIEMLERVCRSLGGFEPDIRHRVDDAELLLTLVAHDRVVAIVPGLARPHQNPAVAVRRVKDGSLKRRIFTAVRSQTGERPPVSVFHDAVLRRIEELGLNRPAESQYRGSVQTLEMEQVPTPR